MHAQLVTHGAIAIGDNISRMEHGCFGHLSRMRVVLTHDKNAVMFSCMPLMQ